MEIAELEQIYKRPDVVEALYSSEFNESLKSLWECALKFRDEIYSMACTIQHPGIRSMYLQPRFAAIDALTRNLALEWGSDYDIRVNGIAQGPIGDTAGMSKLAPEEIINNMREHMPLYKLGEKWDIAMAAVYMASDAGKYINGSVLPVDGGLWLSRPRHLAKDAVRQVSRAVEKRTRAASIGVPKSKL
ncbi:hypothetical protein ACS0TY_035125 [Phlomoides rotata]